MGGTLRDRGRSFHIMLATASAAEKDISMFRKLLVALVATASLGVATMASAEVSDRYRYRHHNNGGVVIQFGGFNGGYYGNRFEDRHRYRTRDRFYSGEYRSRFRYRDRYAYDYDDDFGPACTTRRVKVKDWNRAHTRYRLVTKRVRTC
jgi:hypothetical protein